MKDVDEVNRINFSHASTKLLNMLVLNGFLCSLFHVSLHGILVSFMNNHDTGHSLLEMFKRRRS